MTISPSKFRTNKSQKINHQRETPPRNGSRGGTERKPTAGGTERRRRRRLHSTGSPILSRGHTFLRRRGPGNDGGDEGERAQWSALHQIGFHKAGDYAIRPL